MSTTSPNRESDLINALAWLLKSHPSQLEKLAESKQVTQLEEMWKELHEVVVQREDWLPYQDVAERLMSDDQAVDAIDLKSLLMVFTVHIRKERFCEGHFGDVVRSGHLFKLLRRLRSFVQSGEPMTEPQRARYGEFCNLVRRSVPHLLNTKGSSLYGHVSNLRPGTILVMGTNPGTGPMPWTQTVEESLDWGARNPQRHGYVDSFAGKPSVLSRRLQWVVGQLGHEMRDVQATNLMFRATANTSDLEYPEEATACWPVHEWLIQTIKPKMLIVFGTSAVSPFNFLRRHLGWRRYEKRVYPAGHGKTCVYGVTGEINGHILTVVGMPHPSIFEIRTPEVASALRPEALFAGIQNP